MNGTGSVRGPGAGMAAGAPSATPSPAEVAHETEEQDGAHHSQPKADPGSPKGYVVAQVREREAVKEGDGRRSDQEHDRRRDKAALGRHARPSPGRLRR